MRYLAIIGLFVLVGWGAYTYYQDTQSRLKTLQENNARLEVSVRSLEEVKATLIEDAQKQAVQIQKLNSRLQDAEGYKDDLIAKLQKHDLTKLSLQRPKDMEKIINDETKKLFTDFESITAVSYTHLTLPTIYSV